VEVFTLLGTLTLSAESFEKALEDVKRRTEQTATKMSSDMDAGAKAIEKRLENLGHSMQKFGLRWSLAVSLPLKALGIASIKAASDAEETASKFGVVYRSVTADANRMADTLVESYGQSRRGAQQLLADTGDLLTGFGFTGEAALELAGRVATLGTDLASFTNYSGGAEGAAQALTRALLGERESLKSLGIAISEADVEAKVLELTQRGLTFETERQAKAYATLELATEQSKNAVGDFQRTSAGFANQLRIMTNRFEDVRVAIGEVLLPVVTRLVGWLTRVMDSFLNLSPAMRTVVIIIGAVAVALGPLVTLFGTLLTMLPLMKAGFIALRAAVAPLTLPLVLITAAIGLLVLAWKRDWFGIQDFTKRAVAYITERISFIVRAGRSVIENWETVQFTWGQILESMGYIAGHAGEAVAAAWEVSTLSVKRVFTVMFAFIEENMAKMVNGVVSGVNAVIRGINSVLGTNMRELEGIVMDAWDIIDTETAAAVESAMGRVADAQSDLRAEVRFIQATVATALDIIRLGMEDTEEGVNAVAEAAEAAGMDVDAVLALLETDANAVAEVLEGVGDDLDDLAAKAREAFMAVAAAARAARVYGGSRRDAPAAPVGSTRDNPFVGGDVPTAPDALAAFIGAEAERRFQEAWDASVAAAEAAAEDAEKMAALLSDAHNRVVDMQMDIAADRAALAQYHARMIGDPQTPGRNVLPDVGLAVEPARSVAMTPELWVEPLKRIAIPFVTAVADLDRMAAEAAREQRQANDRQRQADVLRYGTYGAEFTNRAVNDPRSPARPMPVPNVAVTLPKEATAFEKWLEDANDALKSFGDGVLAIAKEKVPALGAAIEGFANGGPMGALAAVFTQLLGESEVFGAILERVNGILTPVMNALDAVLEALWPIIDVAIALVEGALQPLAFILEHVVAPVFEFVARIIVGIWNAIVTAINWALGWLGVNLRKIELNTESPQREQDREDEEQRKRDEALANPAAFDTYEEWLAAAYGGDAAKLGILEKLQTEQDYWQAKLNAARTEAEVATANLELARIDTEFARLRALGFPVDDVPSETPEDERERIEQTFGGVPQSVQFAVATPLVEASDGMLEAATMMRDALAAFTGGGEADFRVLPPFTTAIANLTPVLERMLAEGVNVRVAVPTQPNPWVPTFGALRYM
jgi:hypothetical protein